MFSASWKRSSRVPTASTARNWPSESTIGRAIVTTHSLPARDRMTSLTAMLLPSRIARR